MIQEISVDKAIARGHLMVNVPVLASLIGTPLVANYLTNENIIPSWGIAVSVLVGFVLAWIVWSLMITKWRIWAFANVRNVHELKRRAIEEKLIWKDGSYFEKTEIRDNEDELALKKLQRKFEVEDQYREDFSLPRKTEIYLSKYNIYFGLGASILTASVAIFLLTQGSTQNIVLGGIMLVIGVFGIVKWGRTSTIKELQLLIDSNGITIRNSFRSWSAIENEKVLKQGSGNDSKSFMVYFYNDAIDEGQYEEIEIDSFDVTPKQLENIIRTYRIRHTKNSVK